MTNDQWAMAVEGRNDRLTMTLFLRK